MSSKQSKKASERIEQTENLAMLIKRIKKTMRKDAGLSTDLERIPLLIWLLFLKWLDDWEIERFTVCEKTHNSYKPILEEPFRWRDWAQGSNNMFETSLLTFVNVKLLPHLATLESNYKENPHEIISHIFKEIQNPMESERLLRSVIVDVNRINFNSSNQVHDLAFIYETLLKNLRDAAGSSGEFYTPRPVIRFMVEKLDPKVGDTILDPAVGTGGFLVESIKYLREKTGQSDQKGIKSINKSIYGIEKKSLPHLLCLMNLLLHGVPDLTLLGTISRENALIHPLNDLDESIDIIMTNPPFGGQEETYLMENFPSEGRSTETCILFLQYIMKRLKQGGKCAVIVPNGFLFGDGAAQYVKKKLLTDFNLHHIILLPEGVFAPYTSIPTNILFFEKGSSTKEIHYIQVSHPDSGKNYSKTNPIQGKYFTSVIELWDIKKEHKNSWIIPVEVFHNNDYDLSPQNPSLLSLFQHSNYEETINEMTKTVNELSIVLHDLEVSVNTSMNDNWKFKPLNELIIEISSKRKEKVELDKEYTFLGVSGEAKGAFTKEPIQGSEIKANYVYRVKEEDLIYNRLFACKGSFSLVPSSMNHCYVSNEFPIFIPKNNNISTTYLSFYLSHPRFWAEVEQKSRGSTPGSRNRLYQDKFLSLVIPIPVSAKMGDFEVKISKLISLRKKFTELKKKLDDLFDELPKQMVVEIFKTT